MSRIVPLIVALSLFAVGPAIAAPVNDHMQIQAGQGAAHEAFVQVAQREKSRQIRRSRQDRIIADQQRLRIPNTRVIPPSAGGVGTTYSDRVVGCTHGAGVAGISGMDRGPAIHNCAFGN